MPHLQVTKLSQRFPGSKEKRTNTCSWKILRKNSMHILSDHSNFGASYHRQKLIYEEWKRYHRYAVAEESLSRISIIPDQFKENIWFCACTSAKSRVHAYQIKVPVLFSVIAQETNLPLKNTVVGKKIRELYCKFQEVHYNFFCFIIIWL